MNNQQETLTATLPITPVEPIIEAPVTAPERVVDYTKPLDAELKAILAKEMDAFLAQPAAGWDLTYKTLYKTLHAFIVEFSSKMRCPEPNLMLDFAGAYKHQGAAFFMSDGTTRLYLGTAFIQKFLINPPARQEELHHRCFRWVIAHELGHLCDPSLNRWANWAKARSIVVSMGNMFTMIGVMHTVFSVLPYLSAIASPQYLLFLAIGLGLKGGYNGLEILLQRRFEYFADKRSMQTDDQFSTQELEFALGIMNAEIAAAQSQAPALTIKQRILSYKLSFFHPSIKKRVAALQK